MPKDRVFHSGERIRLHFAGERDGYLTILQVRASGTASQLYPDSSRGQRDNALQAGQERVFPTDGAWFRFDERPGQEQLMLVFTTDRHQMERLPIAPQMTAKATHATEAAAPNPAFSKDIELVVPGRVSRELWTEISGEAGQPLVFSVTLRHE